MSDLLLSKKYKAFLKCNAKAEFLEGTTARGKTTVGLFKFVMKCAQSPKKIHILSGLDLGTIEKNIITKELGILEDFGDLVQYFPHGGNGNMMPHLELKVGRETKVIYVLGYDNKTRWKKALGGQYGCLYIDEINIADIDFVREASMRADYILATLNPDDPQLPVYDEFINKSRPLPDWESETPKEILAYLDKVPNEGWVHWFFEFKDNLGLSEEKKKQIIQNVPKGTKLYKNKIQGLRGRATGLVFDLKDSNIISLSEAKKLCEGNVRLCTAGLDTAYSQNSDDTFAFTYFVLTHDRKLICVASKVINNRDLQKPLAPSDIPPLFEQFIEENRRIWGFARDVFIDSADRATITECQKYRLNHGSLYSFYPAWKQTKIVDRIHFQIGWMAQEYYLVVRETCGSYIDEMNTYSWKEDKYEPEDGHDHCINSRQYAWLPFKNYVGKLEGRE